MYPRVQATAYHMLRLAEEQQTGSLHTAFASIVFSAFLYEAALNEVGLRFFEGWDQSSQRLRSREAKEKALNQKFGMRVDPESGEGVLIARAIEIRDSFAHPKPATDADPDISGPAEFTLAENMTPPAPRLVRHQEYATPEFAERVFDAVTAFATRLFQRAGVDENTLSMGFEYSSFDDVDAGSR
jgi:hypothetical protein